MRLTDRERAGERARESERGTLTEREREGARELLPLTDQHVPHMDVTECVYVRVFVCARARRRRWQVLFCTEVVQQ